MQVVQDRVQSGGRYNKPGNITKEFWEKAIQFHGTFHGLKNTNWFVDFDDSKICEMCDGQLYQY